MGMVVNMGVAWRYGTLILVERDFLGRLHLQRRPCLFFLLLPPAHPHPPGVQLWDSWSPAGSLVSARLAAHSPQGRGISLYPQPWSLVFPSLFPTSLPQQLRDWLECNASRQHPSLAMKEHL